MTAAGADVAARAATLLQLGRPADAEPLLRAALQSEPENPELLRLLSQALLATGQMPEARKVAERAVAADPDNVLSLSGLAAVASAQGDHRDALAAVERALFGAPSFGDLHRQHAEILLANGKREAAVAAARRSRQLAPQSADIAVVLGEILLANSRPDEARTEIVRALSLDPENARAHRASGRLHLLAGGGQPSIVRYREALRLDPTDVAAQRGLATALKSRNPAFRGMLRFEIWVEGLPAGKRWMVRLAPLILSRVFRAMHNPLGNILFGVLVAFLALTWATEPVSNLVLMTRSTERALLTRGQRITALGFIDVVGVAIVCLASALGGARSLAPYAVGFGVWAFAVGSAHTVSGRRMRQILLILGVAAATAGAVGLVCVAIGARSGAVAASAVLVLTSIPAFWISTLAE
jgi:tetratricopeptide (TPR) repeat protein